MYPTKRPSRRDERLLEVDGHLEIRYEPTQLTPLGYHGGTFHQKLVGWATCIGGGGRGGELCWVTTATGTGAQRAAHPTAAAATSSRPAARPTRPGVSA